MWTYTEIWLGIENSCSMDVGVCIVLTTFIVVDGHMKDRVNVQANIHTNYAQR